METKYSHEGNMFWPQVDMWQLKEIVKDKLNIQIAMVLL